MPTAEETTAAETAAAAQAASDTAATEKAAADRAASEQATADKAAADKVAADAAAAAANAGKTPEQLAAEKTAADTETARMAAAQAKAPEKYDLTLPENSPFIPEDLAPIEAEAKVLKLSAIDAQALVDHHIAQRHALATTLKAQLAADPELGGTHLPKTTELAVKGLEAVFPKGTPGSELIRGFLNRSGLGDHPEVIRAFVRIGRARSEDTNVSGNGAVTTIPKTPADVLYGTQA